MVDVVVRALPAEHLAGVAGRRLGQEAHAAKTAEIGHHGRGHGRELELSVVSK